MKQDNPYLPPSAEGANLTTQTLGKPSPVADRSVHFAGQVTLEQYRYVQSLLVPWWAKPYVTLIMIFSAVLTVRGWHDALASPLELVAELIVILVCCLPIFVLVRYLSRKNWKVYRELHGQLSGVIGPDGVECNSANTTSKYSWGKILKCRRGLDMTLVFYAPRCAFFFPRTFFASAPEWDRFNAIVDEHVPK